MSAFGPWRTCARAPHCPLLAQSGHGLVLCRNHDANTPMYGEIDLAGAGKPFIYQSHHSYVTEGPHSRTVGPRRSGAPIHEPDRVANLLFHIVPGHSVIF